MHFMIKWEVRVASHQQKISAGLLEAIKPLLAISPISDCLVVNVKSAEEYAAVKNRIIEFAKANPPDLYLLVSPLMTGPGYAGWLPSTVWPELNKLVT
jgi:hypothetical protein